MDQTPEHDLLHDIEQDTLQREANPSLRLANYIIDLISFYALLWALILIIAFFFHFNFLINFIDRMPDMTGFIGIHFLYGIYMIFMEGMLKGRTIGKFITRTRVVRNYSSSFSWADAVKRGCMRMIPLEYITAITGAPFHDQWTETRVVMEKLNSRTPF